MNDYDELDYGPGIPKVPDPHIDRRSRPVELRHWNEGTMHGRLWWIDPNADGVISVGRDTMPVAEWARFGWVITRIGQPPDATQ